MKLKSTQLNLLANLLLLRNLLLTNTLDFLSILATPSM